MVRSCLFVVLQNCDHCFSIVTRADCFFRIRTERNGGAWCPKQPISRDTYEWLEIDLQELKVVTQVETQGRFGYGQVRPASLHHVYALRYRWICVVGRWRVGAR